MASGGGAEKVMAMIANHMVCCGWTVDVVLLLGNEINKSHFQLDDRLNFWDISPQNNHSYIINTFSWIRKIRNIVKKTHPDLIISFFGRINSLVLTATIGMNIPVIVSERNDPRHDGRGKFMYNYCNLVYRRAKAIVYQTKYEQQCFSPLLSYKSHIIPNPINIIDVPQKKNNRNLIISVGRLRKHKNQEMLIKAVSLVAKQLPHIRCQIYGEGINHDELQELINTLNIQDVVSLEGTKSNILDYVAAGHIFVTTSNHEGLSNALLEAMMLEKICISTDYDGADDIIDNGKNGIIVPKNDEKKLSEVLIDILTDTSEKYQNMAREARVTVLEYDSPIIMKKWDNLINSLLVKNLKVCHIIYCHFQRTHCFW